MVVLVVNSNFFFELVSSKKKLIVKKKKKKLMHFCNLKTRKGVQVSSTPSGILGEPIELRHTAALHDVKTVRHLELVSISRTD